MKTISEKTYGQITSDLDVLFLYPPVIDFIKTNNNFRTYLAKDLNIINTYEQEHPEYQNGDRILSILNNLWQTQYTKEELLDKYPFDEEDVLTNHKILKQQLYKNLSLTINEIKENLSNKNKQLVKEEVEKLPDEEIIDESLINDQNPNPNFSQPQQNLNIKQAHEQNLSQPKPRPKTSNGFLDFFRKPEGNVDFANINNIDQLRKLSLDDKFLHAKKTQAWYKHASNGLMWIYFMPVNKKKRILLVKTNFVKNFNQTYGTHFQIANLERRFDEIYIRKVDGTSFKNAVRIWIVVAGLPIVIMIILLATLLPNR